jgi:hypothetical protein
MAVDTLAKPAITNLSGHPVFVDASGRRGRRFRMASYGVGLACSAYVSLLAISVTVGVVDLDDGIPLPALGSGIAGLGAAIAEPGPARAEPAGRAGTAPPVPWAGPVLVPPAGGGPAAGQTAAAPAGPTGSTRSTGSTGSTGSNDPASGGSTAGGSAAGGGTGTAGGGSGAEPVTRPVERAVEELPEPVEDVVDDLPEPVEDVVDDLPEPVGDVVGDLPEPREILPKVADPIVSVAPVTVPPLSLSVGGVARIARPD